MSVFAMEQQSSRTSIPPRQALGLLNIKPVVLVTTCDAAGHANVTPMAWSTPVSFAPPLYAICAGVGRKAWENLQAVPEFGVNVATEDLLPAVYASGQVSGREVDKVAALGWEIESCEEIRPPLLSAVRLSVPCRVHATQLLGDHAIVVGEVLGGRVEADLVEGKQWRMGHPRTRFLYHFTGPHFAVLASRVTAQPLSD